ncbi:MAG: zinc ABC transporter substrate-binding protein [Nitrospirae bacterium]|nr:zinc ABC transporter substrate-binding protein [Nitrospirota bacterium]
MKKFLTIFLLLISICFNPSNSHAEKIKVIASIHPLGDFVKQVAGDSVDVRVLLPAGASPHTFEPTSKAVKDVSEARVFIKIGAGLEFWAEKMIKSSGNKKLIVIDCSEGLPLIKLQEKHNHHISEYDPHIWLDPLNVLKIIDKISKTLSSVDPLNAALYKKNAESYKESIIKLDNEISKRVNNFKIKEYVTFHPAWNYFSKRYGLKVAGVIEESPGKEPGPKHISKIIKEIKRIGSKVVFVEPQFNPKIASVIAKDANAQIVYLDPIGGQKGKETYIDMMKYNISSLESVMR